MAHNGSGSGGARKGAGAKKNQHRIAHGELREALEKALGIPYVQMLAETQLKLFNDFKNDINIKDYIRFTENMSQRIIQPIVQEVSLTNASEMSTDEIKDRVNNLLTLAAISEPIQEPSGEDEASETN